MREVFGRIFRSAEEEKKTPEFKVGDLVRHPFRDEDVPILFKGTEIYIFVPKAYLDQFEIRGKKTGTYEAIDGSGQFNDLAANPNFVKQKLRSEPSVEIDLSNDVEVRTLVVPIEKLSPANR